MGGCATTANFFELTPTGTNNHGYWTGAHNNVSVATLKLNQDGTGVICQDYQGEARVQSIKKVGNKVIHKMAHFGLLKMKPIKILN